MQIHLVVIIVGLENGSHSYTITVNVIIIILHNNEPFLVKKINNVILIVFFMNYKRETGEEFANYIYI